MVIKTALRTILLGGVGAVLMTSHATADEDTETAAQLRRQIDAMQRQFQRDVGALRKQLDSLEKKAAHPANSAAARSAKPASPATGPAGQAVSSLTVVPATSAPPTQATALPSNLKLGWGGFAEFGAIARQRNEVGDVATDFNDIPYPLTPLYHEREFRFSARQSRLWFLGEGLLSPRQIVNAYFEMDFLGAATTSNSVESNSYAPRVRQAFASYDDTGNGWHVVAGQAWSLATQNKAGIRANDENIPATIEGNYVVGFNWARQPQMRIVKAFDPAVSVGVSAESPQVRFQTPAAPTPLGVVVNSANTGTTSGLMNSLQSYSVDGLPDFIEKAAFDPGWGHYEVLGLQRWFTDRVQQCAVPTASCSVGGSNPLTPNAANTTGFGWGVGASFLVPVLPRTLDVQGSFLYGNGIGRYASGQLPDVTVAPNGALRPVAALQTMVGAVAHAAPGLEIYAYAGLERDRSNYSTVTNGVANNTGFGNPLYSDALCGIENAVMTPGSLTSPVTGVLSNTANPGCSVTSSNSAK